MVKNIYHIVLILCTTLALTSCSTDDNAIDLKEEILQGSNSVTFTFEHKMFGEVLQYNSLNAKNANGEKLNITFLKYIISNFQLTNSKGEVFTYPKDKGYFFVDSQTNDYKVVLENVPAGKYTKVKFGLGVDQEKYLRGMEDQQAFWDLCQQHNLIWGWITGYKFLNYQGLFIEDGAKDEVAESRFQLHIGSHGSSLDNYRETLLQTKEAIVVSNEKSSNVVINVEVSKILDSTNKVKLKDKPSIMVDKVNAPKIMENMTTIFSMGKVENKQ